MTRLWAVTADWIYPPSHDRIAAVALGSIAGGALLILAAAHRISHHA